MLLSFEYHKRRERQGEKRERKNTLFPTLVFGAEVYLFDRPCRIARGSYTAVSN